MSTAYIQEESLTAIANAIRLKNGSSDTYTPTEMATAIEAIETEGITPTGSISITANNTYDVTNYAAAVVNVPGIVPMGSISITENNTYDVTNYASAVVNVAGGGGASAKYGITIDNIIGDVNSSGVLQNADAATTITFTGVQEIDKSKGGDINYLMMGKNLGGISAPALTNLGWESAISSFESCPITSISFPLLVTASFNRTFAYCTGLTSVEFPELVTILGNLATFLHSTNITSVSFPKLTTIKCQSGTAAESSDNGMFEYCSNLTSVNFPELVTIGQLGQSSYVGSSSTGNGSTAFFKAMHRAFFYCSKLTSVSFPKLKTISGSYACTYMFAYCTKLDTVSFPSLEVIEGTQAMGYLFNYSKLITSITFPSLKRIGHQTVQDNAQFYQAFNANTMITDVYFPELTDIYCSGTSTSNGTFAYCQKLQKIYLPKLTNIASTLSTSTGKTGLKNLFYNCTALTEIHFGAENQATIEALEGYSTKWGAPSACQILFDL